MDDKEYYSLMNRPSSYALQQALKAKQKKTEQEKKSKKAEKSPEVINSTYASLELRQGKADAEMLMEKSKD